MTILAEGTPDAAGFDPEAIAKIRERAQSWVDEGLTPSLVVLAARRGVVALHEAFGRSGPEPDAPALSVDAVYPVSSLCKPMTATLLMMLVEDGRLSIDLPVAHYLPDYFHDSESMTVRHLLTHTSGISDADVMAEQVTRLKQRIDLPPCPQTRDETVHLILEARRQYRPQHAPGEVMMYCTHGYELIAEIVRRLSGRPFASFARERLFEPLGMSDSSYLLEDRHRGRLVRRQPFNNMFGVDLNDERYLSLPSGGGGLKSTALDVARFGQLFLNGGRWGDRRLISRATIAQMTRNQIADGVGEEGPWGASSQASYGFGWFVLGDERWPVNGALVPSGAYAHMGMGGSSFWIDPVNELVGVVLSVWDWPRGVERMPFLNPPLLSPARFQDMVTAAVV